MDTFNIIKTNKDGVDISKLIWTICHQQDGDKQDFMVGVETYKQVYLFLSVPLSFKRVLSGSFQYSSQSKQITQCSSNMP